MYAFKRFVDAATSSLGLTLLLLCIALLSRLLRRRRVSVVLCACAGALAYLFALAPVSDLLLAPLEQRYPPLLDAQAVAAADTIVVLGGSYSPRRGQPVTAALAGDSLARVTEGLRLLRHVPGARLVLSGGAPDGQTPSALGYAKLASELGVAASAIVRLETPLDTGDEAAAVKQLLGTRPFILVTSAYHMPRAMALMTRQGTNPIPAPTGQLVDDSGFSLHALLPRPDNLLKTDRALHEYVGLLALSFGQD